jgi:hypothetical protein
MPFHDRHLVGEQAGLLYIWGKLSPKEKRNENSGNLHSRDRDWLDSRSGGDATTFERRVVLAKCEFHGCVYPATRTLVGKDYMAVCRIHEAFLEEEEGEFVERAVAEELLGQRFTRDPATYFFDEGISIRGKKWSFPSGRIVRRDRWLDRQAQRREGLRILDRLSIAFTGPMNFGSHWKRRPLVGRRPLAVEAVGSRIMDVGFW